MIRFTFLLIFEYFIVQCCCSSIEKRGYLATLDDGNLQKLDIGVRKEILFLIVKQINETSNEQAAVSKTCEVKINATVDACQKCNQDLCTPQPPPTYLAIAQALATYAYSPVVATGEFIKSIGESLEPAAKILGSGASKFVHDLGSVSKTVGTSLKDGAESVLNKIGSGFESLGDKFTDLGKSIGSSATDAFNGLKDGTTDLLSGLGSEFTSLKDQLGGALDNLGSGLTDLGNSLVDGVKNVGSSIGHAFGHIFGKRHLLSLSTRCTSSCPSCTTLDTKAHTKEEILKTVCGEPTISSQKEAIQTISFLKALYNNTLTNHLITKVEYDPTHIKTEGGIAFSSNFATFSIAGKTVRFHSTSDLSITDIPSTAKSLAKQIWAKL